MIKTVSLLAIWIFAPPLVLVAVGSQLIYASYQVRRRRLSERTQRLIHAHTLRHRSPLITARTSSCGRLRPQLMVYRSRTASDSRARHIRNSPIDRPLPLFFVRCMCAN
jgi:hypothetical protein